MVMVLKVRTFDHFQLVHSLEMKLIPSSLEINLNFAEMKYEIANLVAFQQMVMVLMVAS